MDYQGKVAFITGGASGAGVGQAQLFGRLGCSVFIVDIRADALDAAAGRLRDEGVAVVSAPLDLTDRSAYARVADMVETARGGPPDLLFNTAGVFAIGPTEASTYDDFDWVLGVNLGGVINGMVTFVPRMIRAGKGGHIVTTASVGGLQGYDSTAIYCASKAAVVSLMEGYRQALQKHDIGVSLLCPMNIRSNIAQSSDTRPPHLRGTGYLVNDETKRSLQSVYAQGMDPLKLAAHVRDGIDRNQAYIIPYPEARPSLELHYQEILGSIPPVESDPNGVATRLKVIDEWVRERGDLFDRKSSDAPC